jgi:aconitate hydratase
MGVLPLQLPQGVTWQSLGLEGSEKVRVRGLAPDMTPRAEVMCCIERENGATENITLRCRLDTRREIAWYQSGGILNFVFDQIRARTSA